MRRVVLSVSAILLALAISGCASTWSTASVEPVKAQAQEAGTKSVPTAAPAESARTSIDEILLTEDDITDRPYTVLGDISVTVRKTTLFSKDPTREQVDEELRREAAKLGADAVILIRYGTVGVGALSWGVLDGKGRAIKFN